MGLTIETIDGAIRRAGARAAADEQEINAADGKLGDGDTGITLRRVFEKLVAASDERSGEELGAYLKSLSAAASSASGSSLATLMAVALNALARETKAQQEIGWDRLGELLAKVRDTMIARGGASLGDKTVVDALDAVATAITGKNDPDEMGRTAVQAANEALLQFRDRPCRMGRARMFAERSVGLDDPGMLAFTRLLEAAVAENGQGR